MSNEVNPSLALEIDTRLAEIFPLYSRIEQLQAELSGVQQAEVAQRAWELFLLEPRRALERLRREYEELRREHNQLEEQMNPVSIPVIDRPDMSIVSSPVQFARAETSIGQVPFASTVDVVPRLDRRAFGNLVRRFAGRWMLKKTGAVSLINRIIQDDESLLGEALVLLDWSVYRERLLTEQDDIAHLERLNTWEEELSAYHSHLEGLLAMERTRSKDVLPIWHQWLERDTPAGKAAWEQFLADSYQAVLDDQAQVRLEIMELCRSIVQLQVELAVRRGEQTS